jgi:hypothetical protein
MASFFSKLFGGGGNNADAAPAQGEQIEYKGLVIRSSPKADGGQWRLSGVIIKQSDDGPLERQYMRADVFTRREEAEEFGVRKGKQIIDEQGDLLFTDGVPTGRA